MKKANEAVFSKLLEYVSLHEPGYTLPKGIRYIATTGVEKDWLRSLKIVECFKVLPNIYASIYDFNGGKFYCFIGWADIIGDDDLPCVELNAGLFTALVSELPIFIRNAISPKDIIGNILSQHLDSAYKGHSYEEL